MQDIENGKNTDIYRLNLDATTLDGIWTAIDNGQQYFYGWDDQGKIHRIAIQDGKNIHQKLMGDYTNQAGKYEPLWQNVEEPLPNALHAKNHYERDKVNTIKKLDLKIDKNGLYTREKHKGIYAFADDGTLYYSGKSEGNKVYDLKEDKRNSINKPQEAFPQDLLAAAIERGTVENSA
ncbi:MAG: hypothetical protein LBG52_05405 [Candidatus Peribacteria bacterium]|nr:hypothetical protein [Candidatus Peribacteria bacterium]